VTKDALGMKAATEAACHFLDGYWVRLDTSPRECAEAVVDAYIRATTKVLIEFEQTERDDPEEYTASLHREERDDGSTFDQAFVRLRFGRFTVKTDNDTVLLDEPYGAGASRDVMLGKAAVVIAEHYDCPADTQWLIRVV
jgi:hypothetical protein